MKVPVRSPVQTEPDPGDWLAASTAAGRHKVCHEVQQSEVLSVGQPHPELTGGQARTVKLGLGELFVSVRREETWKYL